MLITLCFIAFAVIAKPTQLNPEAVGGQLISPQTENQTEELRTTPQSDQTSRTDDVNKSIAKLKEFLFSPRFQQYDRETLKNVRQLRVAIANLQSQAEKLSKTKARSPRKVRFSFPDIESQPNEYPEGFLEISDLN
jgi:hypothetical protein